MSSEINFVETDPDTIINEMIKDFEAISGRILGDADPVQLLIRWAASIVIQERELINESAKMNLRQFATGEYLEALADFIGCERLGAKAAETTIRFYLSKGQSNNYVIPQGTRVAAGELYFETKEQLTILPYQTQGDVIAVCTTPGTIGNGYEAGEINELVDVFQYYSKCENLTTSNGGTDEETDDELRERMRISLDSYSTAGPQGAYEYAVKSVSSDIIDVFTTSPDEGEVDIYFLMTGGEIPSEELIADVKEALDDEKIRPLTDKVNVYAPYVTGHNIKLTYYINAEDESIAKDIDTAVRGAVDEYVLWQKSKIGRDINPSKLTAMIIGAGAKRVEITTPVYTEIDSNRIAVALETEIISGGVEDD